MANKDTLREILSKYYQTVLDKSSTVSDTPLVVIGWDLQKDEPIKWSNITGETPVISSLTRLLHFTKAVDLSHPDSELQTKTDNFIKYYLDNYTRADGLINWGGHVFVDPVTKNVNGPTKKKLAHELKSTFPDYDAMYRLDPEKTLQFIRAFWVHHVIDDEGNVNITRHVEAIDESKLLDIETFSFQQIVDNPDYLPGSKAVSLTFLSTANDLIYAALKYYKYTQDYSAVEASQILLNKYIACRDPVTGLHGQLYTVPIQQMLPENPKETFSWFGDRAQRQMGRRFGDKALEMNMLTAHEARVVFVTTPLLFFSLYMELGDVVLPMCKEVVRSLEACMTHVCDASTGICKPMLTDGTDLTGYALESNGYFGPEGQKFNRYQITFEYFGSTLLGAVLFDSPILNQAVKDLFHHFDLGTINSIKHGPDTINETTGCSSHEMVLALTDAYKITNSKSYLKLAGKIVDNIIAQRWAEPYFKHNATTRYAQFSIADPYALAYYLSALEGKEVAPALRSYGIIYGDYLSNKGLISFRDDFFFKQDIVLSPGASLFHNT
jgi:hypothetical protein